MITKTHQLQQLFETQSDSEYRSRIGHFGTPPVVAEYMASMFSRIPLGEVRILDAGAGVGVLTSALCERIARQTLPRKVHVVLFENESSLIPLLKETLASIKKLLHEAGHKFSYEIKEEDFILFNAPQVSLFNNEIRPINERFDFVIMNPPYFKLRKDSIHAKVMHHIINGQPNIYSLFMAVGAQLLRDGGEIVAITPRSYCNGLYFKEFRKWFFDRITPFHIHLFDSRTDTFQESKVLQEIIILAGKKSKKNVEVKITTSNGRDFHKSKESSTPLSRIIDDTTGDKILRIPSNNFDKDITDFIDSFKDRFNTSGFNISTGPIVTFRAKEFLLPKVNGENAVPLISMHNVKPFRFVWPSENETKNIFFKNCSKSRSLLLASRNYLLLKRFTSKEEKRRIVASVFLAKYFPYTHIGLENHLNYIYKTNGEFSQDEAYGLAAILNSALYDRYFRTINGNTQVNATEIRTLPIPESQIIKSIGEKIQSLESTNAFEIEKIILEKIKINGNLKDYLLEIAG